MSIARLSAADLNLLPVFQVLLEERNVTRAAGRLNLTQPAISRNLARLRQLFNDPLFTRTPKGLSPTPRAEALASKLYHSLQELSLLIEPPLFIPSQAQNTFRLATTDYGTQVLLPAVISRLRREAPQVDLEIIPWQENLLHQLDQESIDLAICTVTDAPAAVHGRGVGDDKFVCVVSAANPLSESGIDLQAYARQPHALITMGGARKGAIDYLLEEQGLARRIALRVPHFVAALSLVAQSDLILTIPFGLAQSCAQHYQLKILPFPMEQSGFTYSIVWHERYMKDAAHIWLRQLVFEELTQTLHKLKTDFTA
ncbi:LysR family transcriptional regulator [Neptunomonas qingdaonensis]|uniref:DNA-binding transcriptional regulator, LysR family n=1 Tax=Neptunomonas qingdaonensis TaxID=1045558 RepID=A0A1I2V5J9_9GAMM|nr:LysR family transcriptional regulator [Neptunomonas qingdaonensis]SFG84655.1 DNA-binding transcriptional regulator, LysR family [Neptunomonas qingdaonensis]